MNRRLIALALAATAAFTLTACTGGGSGGEPASDTQTVEEACAAVNETIEGVAQDFAGLSAQDPAATASAFQAAAGAVSEASANVDNAEVAALLPDIETAFEKTGEAMASVAEGDTSKVAELQTLTTDLQDSVTAFQELCLP
jgi:hypothetical protein